MGWTYPYHTHHRADLIAERIQDHSWPLSTGQVESRKALAHSYRGGNFNGVLWIVWADYLDGVETFRFIECDLLNYYTGTQSWGYKDMEESMHPYYYSCPLGYLDMVPQVGSEEWREGVRRWHAERSVTKGIKLKVGDRIRIREGFTVKGEGVISGFKKTKPIADFNTGRYVVSRTQIAEVIQV